MARLSLSNPTVQKLSRFGLVGGIGFVVDAGLTTTLIHAGLDPFSARVVAIAFAMLVTWRLNRAITFGASDTSQKSEGVRYFAVALAAAAVNYAAYAAFMLICPALMPAIAVALATGVSMVVSYLGFSRFAFKRGV